MKIGLIGLGNAGRTLHLPALQGLPGVTVAAADSDASRREAAARQGVTVFPSLEALLAAGVPDVVIVATPPDTHVALATQALAAGAHVVCEKPFAPSVAEAEAIVQAATRAGRRVALNHEFREMPIFRALRDQLGTPEVGRPVFVQAWQNMDLPPWKEPNWRSQLPMGVLYEAGLHLVDYTLALFGERPVAVTAAMSSCGVREEASDSVALVTLEFSRGRLAQVIQNRLCPGETQYFEVRADCERASLRASFGGRARISAGLYRSTRPHVRLEMGASGIAWRETGHTRRIIASNPKDPAMVATRMTLERTLASFRDGTAPPASAEDGLDGLLALAACYRSAASGQRVLLDGPVQAQLRTQRLG
jgi:predicted dehydrogenase